MKRPLFEKLFPPEVVSHLREAGFECATIASNPERIRVMKHNCAALFQRQPDRQLRLAQSPGYLFRGEIGRLWDAGYQKFWLLGPPTSEPFNPEVSARRPVVAGQLNALQRFQEELKHALGIPSFYNESIGTTNDITAYDRLEGHDSTGRQRLS